MTTISQKTNIYNIYVDHTNNYKKVYGDNTVVLLMVGGFYELYSNNTDDNIDIFRIASVCNLIVSKKSKGDIYMAGMPIESLYRYVNILTENNFVCVVVSQTNPKDPSIREVTDIISPSVTINSQSITNYFVIVFLEEYKELLYAGIAAIDISTGRTLATESISTLSDSGKALDEVQRIASTYLPQELLLISKEPIKNSKSIEDSLEPLCKILYKRWDSINISQYESIIYQEETFKKAFKYNGMVSVFNFLGLERANWGRVALCYAIQFAYEHNAFLINNLQKPTIIDNDHYMTIEYDSCIQLNLQSLNIKDKSVLSIINRCSTAFGKRMLKDRLFNPITDVKELKQRYDNIEKALEYPLDKINIILNKVLDLERLLRKIELKRITPADWSNMIMSLEYCEEAFKICEMDCSGFEELKNLYNILRISECSKYSNLTDIKSNIFNKGVFEEIDNIIIEYDKNYENLINMAKSITDLRDNDSTLCKVDNTTRDGYFLSITKNRFETASSINKGMMGQFDKRFSNQSKTNYILINNDIKTSSNNMDRCINSINEYVQIRYNEFLDKFILEQSNNLRNLINTITDLDVTICLARNAKEWNLSKPDVYSSNNSYVNIKGIRHPIIEFINSGIKYVKNDISLNKDDIKGMLLYGINSSGKSSLMKALGINIIMAQAGMYVFCDNIEYSPYKNIMTRIAGNDNIYRGMSTFIVEISELRNILNRGSNKSLILGDEICSGTENISALSIVASSLFHLVQRGCSFIFATHLHELLDIPLIRDMKDIFVGHLSINTEGDNIIYERKIKEGSGSSIYGIEVCRHLKLPLEFMRIAEDVRKHIKGERNMFLENKTSNYNKDLILDMCAVCKDKRAIHTHHIKYQKDCKNEYEKNQINNLIGLCEECHENEHHGKIHIVGYRDTIEGRDIEIIERKELKENNKIELNPQKIEFLKQYIRYGKCDKWFSRKTKRGSFKHSDITNITDKLHKLGYTFTDELKDLLYDPYL